MLISDWSSDVCSSDLSGAQPGGTVMRRGYLLFLPVTLLLLWLLLNESLSGGQVVLGAALALWLGFASSRLRPLRSRPHRLWRLPEIGKAACRAKECLIVWISGGSGRIKKKKTH